MKNFQKETGNFFGWRSFLHHDFTYVLEYFYEKRKNTRYSRIENFTFFPCFFLNFSEKYG